MKSIFTHKVVKWFSIAALAILIVILALYFINTFNTKPDTSSPATSTVNTPSQTDSSRFSFSGAPNWRKGPSNATSMALFHTNGCFTSLEYKTGVVNPVTALEKIQADLVSMNYTVSPGGTVTTSLKTDGQDLQFQLNQYSVTGKGSGGEVKGGQEFGYLQLTKGYIEVKGFCDTADLLSTSAEALQAVEYKKI